MRTRTLSLLTVLALVLAACGGGSADETTTTTEETATTTTTAQVIESPDAVKLSYKLEPGASFEYEVSIDQSIQMTAEGDVSAMGGDDLPEDASISIAGTSTFSHSVAEGSEPGTFDVTITGDFSDLSITGVVDGEPVDSSEIPEFAEMEPVDVTIVVDSQGNIITDEGEFGGDLFGGDIGGMGPFGGTSTPGLELGRFVGPPFTDEEVTVGDSWSETIEIPGVMGADPITTEVTSEVTGTDSVDGSDVFVIETTSVTSPIEFDLADFLIGFFTAFTTDESSDEEKAELQALTENLRFLFTIDETTSEVTTWFDADEGLAREAEYASDAHIVMDLNMPDEESGEMVGFVVDMVVDQKVTYRLLGAESA